VAISGRPLADPAVSLVELSSLMNNAIPLGAYPYKKTAEGQEKFKSVSASNQLFREIPENCESNDSPNVVPAEITRDTGSVWCSRLIYSLLRSYYRRRQ